MAVIARLIAEDATRRDGQAERLKALRRDDAPRASGRTDGDAS